MTENEKKIIRILHRAAVELDQLAADAETTKADLHYAVSVFESLLFELRNLNGDIDQFIPRLKEFIHD